MPILNDKEYRCDFCNQVFLLNKELNAEKEYEEYFLNESKKNREIVCDDCWQLVKPTLRDA
jgi:hypothetical protein